MRVEGDGPHGPLPVLEIQIDISEWRQARDAPDGSLHHVRGAIKDLTKAVGGVDKTMKRVIDRLDYPTPETVELNEMSDTFTRQQLAPPASEDEAESGTDRASLPSSMAEEQ